MQNSIQKRIRSAILLVLRPIARALLAGGIGYREFSEIAKIAFVDVATKDFGIRGRPTNISRVAVMTGLTRKEVRRIRQVNEESISHMGVKDTPIAQILHRWHTDKEFLQDNGTPLPLPYDEGEKSFATLVKKYGGDVPPGAMRTELERIDAVELLDNHKMRPTKRITYNVDLHDKLIGGLTRILFPASLNLVHNLQRSNDSDRWANLLTHSNYISREDRGRFMRISNDRIREFAKSIDDMQAGFEESYDPDRDGRVTDLKTVGIGIFYFEEDKKDSDFFQ